MFSSLSKFSHGSGSAEAHVGTRQMPILDGRRVKILNDLLFEKDFVLTSKKHHLGAGFSQSTPFKVDALIQKVISAFVSEFLSKHKSPLADPILTASLELKGSTAVEIFQGSDLETSDLDLTLKFNRLPHDPRDRYQNILFFKAVARTVSRDLLEAKFGKSQAEVLANDFFDKIIVTEDNSFFLVGFGGIDIVIPIPRIDSLDAAPRCTFLEESLKVCIPLAGCTINRELPPFITSEFNVPLEQIQESLKAKLVHIPAPERIGFNGFERLCYTLTKGFTTLHMDSLVVLVKDLHARTTSSPMHALPLDRLRALILNKQLKPIAALHLFLNAYQAVFKLKDSDIEANELLPFFDAAIKKEEWLAIFPRFVKDSFPKDGSIDLLLSYVIVACHLNLNSLPIQRTADHLLDRVIVIGDDIKRNGFFITPILTFDQWLEHFEKCNALIPKPAIEALLGEDGELLKAKNLSLHDQALFILFHRMITQENLTTTLAQEAISRLPRVLNILFDYPDLIEAFDSMKAILDLMQAYPECFPFNAEEMLFLTEFAQSVRLHRLFPLFYLSMLDKSGDVFETLVHQLKNDHTNVFRFSILYKFLLDKCHVLDPKLHFKMLEHTLFCYFDDFSLPFASHETFMTLLQNPINHSSINLTVWVRKIGRALWTNQEPDLLEFTLKFIEIFPDARIYLIVALAKSTISDEKLLPHLTRAILEKDYLLAQQMIHTRKDLLEMLPGVEALGLLLSISSLEKLTAYIPDCLIRAIQEDASKLADAKVLAFIQRLSTQDFFMIVVDLLAKDTKESHLILSSLMNQAAFQEQFRSIYPRMRNFIHLMRLENRLPKELSKELINLTLVSHPAKFIQPVDVIVILNQLLYYPIETADTANKFVQAVQLITPKLFEIKTHPSFEPSMPIYVEVVKKSLRLSLANRLKLGTAWMKEWDVLAAAEKTFELALADALAKPTHKGLIDLLHRKLASKEDAIEPSLIPKILPLFRDNLVYLNTLLEHVILHSPKEIFEILTRDLYSLYLDENKRDLILKYVENSADCHNISLWLIQWSIPKAKFKPAILDYLQIADAVLRKSDADLINRLLRHVTAIPEFRSMATSSFYTLFQRMHPSMQQLYLDFFIQNFDKLSIEQQHDFLLTPYFSIDAARGSVFEKVLVDITCLNLLFSILNKLPIDHALPIAKPIQHGLMPIVTRIVREFDTTFSGSQELAVKVLKKSITLTKATHESIEPLLPLFLDSLEKGGPILEIARDLVLDSLEVLDAGSIIRLLDFRLTQPFLEDKREKEVFANILLSLLQKIEIDQFLTIYQRYETARFFPIDVLVNKIYIELINLSVRKKDKALAERLFVLEGLELLPSLSQAGKKGHLQTLELFLESAESMEDVEFLKFYVSKILKYFDLSVRIENLQVAIMRKTMEIQPDDLTGFHGLCHETLWLKITTIENLRAIANYLLNKYERHLANAISLGPDCHYRAFNFFESALFLQVLNSSIAKVYMDAFSQKNPELVISDFKSAPLADLVEMLPLIDKRLLTEDLILSTVIPKMPSDAEFDLLDFCLVLESLDSEIGLKVFQVLYTYHPDRLEHDLITIPLETFDVMIKKIYSNWIHKKIASELYPVITRALLHRLPKLVDCNRAIGGLSANEMSSLICCISTLPEIITPDLLPEVYPLFLDSINCLMDKKNTLKFIPTKIGPLLAFQVMKKWSILDPTALFSAAHKVRIETLMRHYYEFNLPDVRLTHIYNVTSQCIEANYGLAFMFVIRWLRPLQAEGVDILYPLVEVLIKTQSAIWGYQAKDKLREFVRILFEAFDYYESNIPAEHNDAFRIQIMMLGFAGMETKKDFMLRSIAELRVIFSKLIT